jgi:hypothetical protein
VPTAQQEENARASRSHILGKRQLVVEALIEGVRKFLTTRSSLLAAPSAAPEVPKTADQQQLSKEGIVLSRSALTGFATWVSDGESL